MSARDELAATIEGALDRSHGIIAWAGPAQEDIADDLLAAGYSKPRIITTAEELEALAEGAAVLDRLETVAICVGRDLWTMGGDEYSSWALVTDWLTLPATVLYEQSE